MIAVFIFSACSNFDDENYQTNTQPHGPTEATNQLNPTEHTEQTKPNSQPTAPSDSLPNEIEPIETKPIETEPTIQETMPKDFKITLSFAGDCTLSNVNENATWHGFESFAEQNEPSYFLEKVKHVFEADDFTIVNLESVLSDRDLPKRDKGEGKAFWFKSKTSNVNILKEGSVEGVSLANNHTFDYGEAGHEDTKEAVLNAGLKYGHDANIMYFGKDGFTIAVICHGLWYESQANPIVDLLKEVCEYSDYQIVFFHGGTEGLHYPEDWKIKACHKLIDNGADLVIGNHPHVLQPIETYNGAQIVYSLGNFCYGGHLKPQNRTMIYQMFLTINYETLQVEKSEQNIIPCYIYTTEYNNYQPAPISDANEIDRVLKFLNWELELPY